MTAKIEARCHVSIKCCNRYKKKDDRMLPRLGFSFFTHGCEIRMQLFYVVSLKYNKIEMSQKKKTFLLCIAWMQGCRLPS